MARALHAATGAAMGANNPPRCIFANRHGPDGLDDLRSDVDRLFGELNILLENLSVDRLTAIPQPHARSASRSFGIMPAPVKVPPTAEYLDPFGTHARNHERIVFFRGRRRSCRSFAPGNGHRRCVRSHLQVGLDERGIGGK